MTILCCCLLELSGRRPQMRQRPRARSAPRRARATRPARKFAFWGTPAPVQKGAHRAYPVPARTHAPCGVCVSPAQSFDPSLPSLGRPRVVPAAPNFSHLGQHRSFTRTSIQVSSTSVCAGMGLQLHPARSGTMLHYGAHAPSALAAMKAQSRSRCQTWSSLRAIPAKFVPLAQVVPSQTARRAGLRE